MPSIRCTDDRSGREQPLDPAQRPGADGGLPRDRARAPARAAFVQTAAPRANHIVVSKSNRVLALMAGEETLKRYQVHLGFAPEGHKLALRRRPHPGGPLLHRPAQPAQRLLPQPRASATPTRIDLARARAMGVQPGGDIFIHGGPRRAADRRKKDWTAGCIAVSDAEIEEIWSMVPTGIPITILA